MLNDRQRAFVREWLRDHNATRAAIRAGYSEKTAAQQASRLMHLPEVQEYRNELLKQEFEALGVTRHSLAAEVYEMMQRCRGGEPHMVWNSAMREYEPDGLWMQNERGFYKGAELLSKMLELTEPAEDGGADYEAMLAGGQREF